MNKTLFQKTYDGESIVDAFRDFSEALTEDFNPECASIPKDQHGFQQGQFVVTIVWKPEGHESWEQEANCVKEQEDKIAHVYELLDRASDMLYDCGLRDEIHTELKRR